MNNKAKKGEYLDILLRSNNTIFSNKDVALMWGEKAGGSVSVRLNYYVKAKKLIRVHRGLYAKDKNYNRYELATRINTPSYISFETVLGSSGMTFQYYGNIFVASYIKRNMEVDGQRIEFVRMKDYVLSNTLGIENSEGYARATKERAYLDRIYVSKKYYIDNESPLDWEKVFEILPIYHNKKMEQTVKRYYEKFKKSQEDIKK
ncbi:MAG: type IV toxin-antitoxin system AbiEi family antitoxin domain-containing protein [Candidatus Pacebacteria bacterium]|nr:type IV toxin-antitoxin system AbiEi family antitoxin domain-containing protein [Candidatus Paceibacterota bacterium]MCF7863110.1 type IV toxin-antitoxin system AbiEi family antitoxin domain-containing protein [Candidatus Paceibacterota bacterium]